MSELSSEVVDYIKNHAIDTEMISNDIELAISSLLGIHSLFDQVMQENSSRLSQAPIGGIVLGMMRMVYAYADSTLLMVLSQQLPASEILSRTTGESAINIMYILNKDTNNRLMIYFADYYYREMKELNQWEEAAKSLKNDKESNAHLAAIKIKREAIKTLPKLFSVFCTVEFPEAKVQFPPVSARFKDLGREIEYQTIFLELSSQVHNSPQDLITRFVAGAASVALGTELYKIVLEQERVRFATILAIRSIGYYIEAVISCFVHFHLDSSLLLAKNYLTGLEKIYTAGFSGQSN